MIHTNELQFHALKIWLIPCFIDNYIFVLHLTDSNKTIVIDPGDGPLVESFLNSQNLTLNEIWITHHHNDHTGGVSYLSKKFSCETLGSIQTKSKLPSIGVTVSGNTTLNISGWTLKILELPGHTNDHIGYWLQNNSHSLLFSGDVIFGLGCGRIFEGEYNQMIDSLKKIASLPISTLIFCSHEYTEKNLAFTLMHENVATNKKLHNRQKDIQEKRRSNIPTIPLSLEEELETNLFLLAITIPFESNNFIDLRNKRNRF